MLKSVVMNFNFHTNHKVLLAAITIGFLTLSLMIAVLPAYRLQENNPPLPGAPSLTDTELRGKALYISEGCQGCHTQQVRSNIIDKQWGDRPSVPADYANNVRPGVFVNTGSVLGSERTGPDLTNIGVRQPGDTWHYLHLYNPRSVVEASVMPAYPWLFDEVDKVLVGQEEVFLPDGFAPDNGKHVVTSEKAKDLVAYLKSLKQHKLPDYMNVEFEAYDWQVGEEGQSEDQIAGESSSKELLKLDGKKLYTANCQVCHQQNGEGIPNAFPSLKGSSIVNNEDPTELITIVLFGFDRDNQYGTMLPFGTKLTDQEIAAIVSYERSSWTNKAEKVTADFVRRIRERGIPANWMK